MLQNAITAPGANTGDATPQALSRPSSQRLPGLDWLRGAASLWVLLYHVDITLQKAKYFQLPPLSLTTSVGYRGVELFFLLSGFVMATTYSPDHAGSWRHAGAFAARRMLRIFPAYLAIFLPLFCLAAWKGLGAPPDVAVDARLFAMDILLLPRDDLSTFIPVNAWTLSHEMMFYAVFLLSFISWRLFLVALTLWCSGCVILAFWGIQIAGWAMPASAVNAYFLLGLAGALVKRDIAPAWRPAFYATAGLTLIVAIGLESRHFDSASVGGYLTQLAYATSFSMWVFGLSRRGVSMPRWFERLAGYFGRISYGLYLLNYPVIVAVALAVKASGLQSHIVPLVVVLAAGLSIAFADLLHRFVERPAIAFGKTLFRKSL